MTCTKCGSLDTEMTGEIRTRDGRFQWECNDCGVRYYRDEGNTPSQSHEDNYDIHRAP